MTTGMRRNEIGDKLLFQSVLAVDFVEYLLKPVEKRERRLAHHIEYCVFGVFGCHFEAAGYVACYQFLIVTAVDGIYLWVSADVHRQVVAHTAPDETFLYSGDCVGSFVDVEQRAVVVVEVGHGRGCRQEGRRHFWHTSKFLPCMAYMLADGPPRSLI